MGCLVTKLLAVVFYEVIHKVLYCYKGCGSTLCTCEQVLSTCLISWDIKHVLSTHAMHLEEDNFAIQYIIEIQNSGMLYTCCCHLNKL